MKALTAEAIARILGTHLAGRPGAAAVTGVSTDSRTTRPGDCFFAIAGEKFDGHEYLSQAFAQGAACAVVSRDVQADGPLLQVKDTVKALGDLAGAYRERNSFKVIAITGSVGKTTTRQMVYHVLSQQFRTHQARKNFNNTIGLPLTLLGAEPDDEVIVAELGANLPGEIAYLTRIAQPNIAIVTNVYPAHLAGFGDLNTVIREKTSIADGLANDGAFLVNGDIDALVATCRGNGRPFRTFGRSPGCDYRAERIVSKGLTSTFTIDDVSICLPVPGLGNVENALAAWALCAQFGVKLDQFAKALQSLPSVTMRAEPLQIGTLTVLNDCYNANPASMANALAILSNLRPGTDVDRSRRLVFICGEMAELGAESESLHAELGRAVAEAGVDLLLTVGRATKTTAAAAVRWAHPRPTPTAPHRQETSPSHAGCLRTEHFDDTALLCNRLRHLVREYDIILVKGSRPAHLESVVQELIKDYG